MATSKKKVVKPKATKRESAAAAHMKKVSDLANELYRTRKSTEALEDRHRREKEEHFKKISDLKARVLSGLKVVGLASVKVRNGDQYRIETRKGYQVKSPIHLDAWARKEGLVKPDMERVKVALNGLAKQSKLPAFVEPVATETISYRSAKKPEGE